MQSMYRPGMPPPSQAIRPSNVGRGIPPPPNFAGSAAAPPLGPLTSAQENLPPAGFHPPPAKQNMSVGNRRDSNEMINNTPLTSSNFMTKQNISSSLLDRKIADMNLNSEVQREQNLNNGIATEKENNLDSQSHAETSYSNFQHDAKSSEVNSIPTSFESQQKTAQENILHQPYQQTFGFTSTGPMNSIPQPNPLSVGQPMNNMSLRGPVPHIRSVVPGGPPFTSMTSGRHPISSITPGGQPIRSMTLGGPPTSSSTSVFRPLSPLPSSVMPPTLVGPPTSSSTSAFRPLSPPPLSGMPPTSNFSPNLANRPSFPPSNPSMQSQSSYPPNPAMMPPISSTTSNIPGSMSNRYPQSNFLSNPSIPGPPTSNFGQSATSSAMGPPPTGKYSYPNPPMSYASGSVPPMNGVPPPNAPQYSSSNLPPRPGEMSQHPPVGMQGRYPSPSQSGPGGYLQGTGGYPQGPTGQGRRLNPDDMPSPLQVIEEDKVARTGEFITNVKGALPPLVTTDFFVKDGGNSSPRFVRSTMYNVPATQEMMKQAAIPFSLIISPLADLQPNEGPLYQGTLLSKGPVRCVRCNGYMSPLMNFMDGGRRFQCLLCKQMNDCPPDYFCHMDSHGCRADKYQRPELCLGSYEYVGTPEYCRDRKPPKEPAFIFVLEMSQLMMQRGIINVICQNMKSLIESFPKDQIPGQEITKSVVKVGFITYDTNIQFYKLNGIAPEMCVVCDKEDMFVPFPDGVLCDPENVMGNIEKLMECIPENFHSTKETSGSLYSAIEAGMCALNASGRTGKLFVFHSSLPSFDGLGKLKNRDDRKVLGTDKEKTVLTPQNQNYNNLAQNLVNFGCGVDLYLFNESYVDLATIGQVARLTGGQCYKYNFFQANKDGERLLDDLRINLSRNITFDNILKVRTSTGVRAVEFYGHFYMSNTRDIELAVMDSSKAVAVGIKHDDKLTEEDGVYIQVAMLYTSAGGQRRIRVLNLALNVCVQMADLFKNVDVDAIVNHFSKESVYKFLDSSARQVKDNLISQCAQTLASYRKNCASPSSSGQLILPELMKLLPLYVNCLLKCDALNGGQDLTCDDKSWHIYQVQTMTVQASLAYLYPRTMQISNLDPNDKTPNLIRTSFEKFTPDSAFLVENGLFMFMWIGSAIPPEWLNDVFGVSAPHQLDPVLSELPPLDNATSEGVRELISNLRSERNTHMRLFVVPQQGKHEVIMRNYLVEDKGVYGTPSYVDFLCHVHKEIRGLLT